MSEHDDDDDEGQPAMQMFFGGVLPPEMQAQMAEQQDRHQMAAEVWRHEINGFLMSLDAEQTLTLKKIFMQMSEDLANYYLGVLTTILHLKHGVCAGCGVNHEEDLTAIRQEKIDKEGEPDGG